MFSVGVAVVTAVLFGMLPALQASRGNLVDSLKEGHARQQHPAFTITERPRHCAGGSRAGVVVGALLFVRTFQNLNLYDVGFDIEAAPDDAVLHAG